MRVFITGVAGFLGSHLADWFLAQGHEVAGNDNMIGGDMENVPAGVDFTQCDICDLEALTVAMKGADVVYHCAAMAYEGVSVFAPATITNNIMTGSATVFSAAIRVGARRVVNCSSMARYGSGDPPFREDHTCYPQDPYGISKRAAEDLLKNLAETHGFEWCVAVPHNIYGERQNYCMAAGSLVKLSTGFRPIEKVVRGDRVLVRGKTAEVVSSFRVDTRKAVRITLRTGQVVTVGAGHRFHILDGDKPSWREAKELRIGDAIFIDTGIGQTIERNSADFRWGQFLGVLIADGTYNDPYQVSVACCVEEDKPDMRQLMSDIGIRYTEDARGRFTIYGKDFVARLRALGLHATGSNKSIPEEVLALGHETVAGVLSGLLSGDGWCCKDTNAVGFGSISEKLVRQVQKLMSAYGIRSNLRRNEAKESVIEGRVVQCQPLWYINITGENTKAFSEIGFIYSRKNSTLAGHANVRASNKLPSGVGSEVRGVAAALPIEVRRERLNLLENHRTQPTRHSLRQINESLRGWLESNANSDPDYQTFLRTKLEKWETIFSLGSTVEVAAIEGVEEDLYDISVESDEHSYVGDGLISHNCDPYRNVPSIMANLMLQGRQPVIYGDGTQKRCFSYVEDSLACLVKMADSPVVLGQTINIGPDEGSMTIRELYDLLANITGFNEEPIFMPGRPQEVHHATCSSDKARELLGYQTTVMPEEGMRRLVDWIRLKGPKPFRYIDGLMEFTNERTPKTWTERLF